MRLINSHRSFVLLLLFCLGLGLFFSGQAKVAAVSREDYESLKSNNRTKDRWLFNNRKGNLLK